MLRIHWVHEPKPPWNSTSGSPSPQHRHTMAPSPQGVSTRRLEAARRSTSAAGVSLPVISAALREERMLDAIAALDAETGHRAAIELEDAEDRLIGGDRIER